jgi:hypothetical protein
VRGWGWGGSSRGLGGKGGEMTQALYAHMNERKFFKKIISLKKKKG